MRELLTEVGVIVIGIVIAIGMEQAVESAHRELQLREARRALGVEHQYNLEAFQILTDGQYSKIPEIKQNLALFSYLRDHPGTPDNRWPSDWRVLNVESIPLRDAAWKNAERTNVIQYMSTAEANKYQLEYKLIDYINQRQRDELAQVYVTRRPIIEAGVARKFTPAQIDDEINDLADLLLLYANVGQRQRNLADEGLGYHHAPDERVSVNAAFNKPWMDSHISDANRKASSEAMEAIGRRLDRLGKRFRRDDETH